MKQKTIELTLAILRFSIIIFLWCICFNSILKIIEYTYIDSIKLILTIGLIYFLIKSFKLIMFEIDKFFNVLFNIFVNDKVF